MALKDILNNAKYADDMVLTLPDGTTGTIGEFRSLDAEERNNLIQRAKTIEQAEIALADRIREAQSRGILNSQPVQTDDAAIRAAAAQQFRLSEDDPLLGQVAKEFKRLEAQNKQNLDAVVAKTNAEIAKLGGITKQVTQAYLDDWYTTRHQAATASLPSDVRSKVKLEDAIKYAEEHRLMDKAGRYDIDASVDRLTWDARKEHERAEFRTDATKKAEKEAQMASMNRPSPNTLRTRQAENDGFNPLTKEGKVKSFDEVLADAQSDGALWDSIAKTASGFGPN
jgi:hypothetical protein